MGGDDMDAATILDTIPAFEAVQSGRCMEHGIDVGSFGLSHVAYRCPTWVDYVAVRAALETVATANHENVWNGRPISKIVLAEPVLTTAGRSISMIELIPPFHQRVYKMGLEHVGYVVGQGIEQFIEANVRALTGRQYQSEHTKPAYLLFPDYTHVKFYERTLQDSCVLEGARFDGFAHVAWNPSDPMAGPYELTGQ